MTTDWNFADVYEAVAARVPDRAVPDPGRPGRHLGRVRPPGQRPRRRPARRRPQPPGQGRRLPLQLPRVPRDATSPPSRRGSPRSTPTTATGPRRSSTCSTTPTPRPSSSTPRSPSCSTAIRDRLPEGAPLVRRRRRGRRRSRLGRRRTSRVVARRRRPRRRRRGAARGDDLLLLYTGGTTGMPKGVMWRQDDLFNVLGAGGNAAARHRRRPTSVDELAGRDRPGRRRGT